MKHKRDKYVKLHPDYANNHVYLIHGKSHLEKGYKSVTSFIKKFFEEFDAQNTVDMYYDRWQSQPDSKYYGMTKEEILTSWETTRDDAAEAGTNMHRFFELLATHDLPQICVEFALQINDNGKFEIKNGGIPDEYENYFQWFLDEVETVVRTEWTVYGAKEKIVGNVDLVYINKFGEYCICDYKRSESPSTTTYGKKCIGASFPHNGRSKHMLQLNVYKYLIEKYYGIKISHLYNLYIKGKDYIEFMEQDIIDVGELL